MADMSRDIATGGNENKERYSNPAPRRELFSLLLVCSRREKEWAHFFAMQRGTSKAADQNSGELNRLQVHWESSKDATKRRPTF